MKLYKCYHSLFSPTRRTKINPNSFGWIKFLPTDEKPISLFSKGFVGCDGTFVYWIDQLGVQGVFGAHYRWGHEHHCDIVEKNLKQIRFDNGQLEIKKAILITFNANFNPHFGPHDEETKKRHDDHRDKLVRDLEDIVLKCFNPKEFQLIPVAYEAPRIGRCWIGDGEVKFTLGRSQSTCKLVSESGKRTLDFHI